ncbi:hypothetical protein [Levilactobacillus enshiensis]|uniref:hypothetical protein n=1 Tax=Levilactobacillus enshiensis TaxID=2590213 RepID=UPI00117A258A|nr:hypothetical protein [Levilactobacillus enshiensis]
MLTGEQIFWLVLTVLFYGWYWRRRWQYQLQTNAMRNRWRYLTHSFWVLSLLYLGLGLWQAAWLDKRVLILLALVDLIVVVARTLWQRRHPFPATNRRLLKFQSRLLIMSQLSLVNVLLATSNRLMIQN